MSQQNLDLVRRIYADWERGDFTSAEWADPSIEWVAADGPATGTWTGMAALAEGTREVLGAFEDSRIQPEEYRELDSERVLVLVRYGGRGKTSGLDLAQVRATGAWLVHVRDGKVTKFVRYWDRARAFADLGLKELAVSQENVEVASDLFEKWNAGVRTVPAEYFDPAVELESPFSSVSGEAYRGYAGIEAWAREVDEQFSEWQIRNDDVREVDNVVIAVGNVHGRGRGSGVEFAQACAGVIDFRSDHRITRIRIFLDVNAALKTVGLEK